MNIKVRIIFANDSFIVFCKVSFIFCAKLERHRNRLPFILVSQKKSFVTFKVSNWKVKLQLLNYNAIFCNLLHLKIMNYQFSFQFFQIESVTHISVLRNNLIGRFWPVLVDGTIRSFVWYANAEYDFLETCTVAHVLFV